MQPAPDEVPHRLDDEDADGRTGVLEDRPPPAGTRRPCRAGRPSTWCPPAPRRQHRLAGLQRRAERRSGGGLGLLERTGAIGSSTSSSVLSPSMALPRSVTPSAKARQKAALSLGSQRCRAFSSCPAPTQEAGGGQRRAHRRRCSHPWPRSRRAVRSSPGESVAPPSSAATAC